MPRPAASDTSACHLKATHVYVLTTDVQKDEAFTFVSCRSGGIPPGSLHAQLLCRHGVQVHFQVWKGSVSQPLTD